MGLSDDNPARANGRLVAVLLGLVLALAAATAYLLATRAPTRRALLEQAVLDPEIKKAATRELIKRSGGIWDSYADPDVGRILQPNLEGRFARDVEIRSNAFGMREDWYAAVKPANTTRVVLLGDSYVFGSGAEASERVGVFLEGYLRDRKGAGTGKVEVLHIGLESWNILAECAYLRRQLADLAPDLVVHFTIDNDLEDLNGVRGFGELAAFSPQVRGRGDCRIGSLAPKAYAGSFVEHWLPAGLDAESRERYARAEDEIARLATAVRARGAQYLHVFQWKEWNATARRHLAPRLADDEVAFLSTAFHFDPAHWVSESDRHWNAFGAERVAKLLFALVDTRALLPALALAPWPDAGREIEAIHDVARDEMRVGAAEPARLRPYLTCPSEDRDMGAQLYVGLDGDGSAGPYVSFVLAYSGERELTLEGATLERAELEGARARVFVEGVEVGAFALDGDAPFPLAYPLPTELDGRTVVNVRIASDDWIYTKLFSGRAASFRLTRAGLR